jgi:hypothetical protein
MQAEIGEDCASFTADAQNCGSAIITAGSPAAACLSTSSTLKDSYAALAPIFCGGGADGG